MIAVFVNPEALTIEKYNKVHERLQASGAPETGRKHHSCFGEGYHVRVVKELGITSARASDVMPVVALVQ
jgi:hypothetical protein